jgi:colanic acid/amylovoran biosynthesis glycosyltransferase
MSLAYLLNWYPMPSQTALRREVVALEELGVLFHRFSLRRYEGELVDEGDRAERDRTRAVLDVGALGLLAAVLRISATRPWRFAQAFAMAGRIGRIDERGMIKTFIYLAEACRACSHSLRDKFGHCRAVLPHDGRALV